ncbi:MAG: Ig-like domain-containing protein [Lachnospiraceae bacterium]|nr:Ig-like domain-containing protein [Lachnospiraceae bacterium]
MKYEITNPKIASVSKKGVIKGKKKGSCYVYIYAQNGVSKKLKVIVK